VSQFVTRKKYKIIVARKMIFENVEIFLLSPDPGSLVWKIKQIQFPSTEKSRIPKCLVEKHQEKFTIKETNEKLFHFENECQEEIESQDENPPVSSEKNELTEENLEKENVVDKKIFRMVDNYNFEDMFHFQNLIKPKLTELLYPRLVKKDRFCLLMSNYN